MKTAAEVLTSLKFEHLGPVSAHDLSQMWMRSFGARDVLLILPENANEDDAVEALYDAGCRDKRDEIAGKHQSYLESLRTPQITATWERARELQKQLREAMTARLSMPKTHHCSELQP
jgi:H2-forming N5,N10-methylenetetrahydromethanopterin dehydrogenase-like enzyme